MLGVRPTQTPRLTEADFWDAFNLRNIFTTDVNPHIPPEGEVSYIIPLGDRKLWLGFTFLSHVFVGAAVHEG
jgi:hypothetical protein